VKAFRAGRRSASTSADFEQEVEAGCCGFVGEVFVVEAVAGLQAPARRIQ